MTHTLSNKMKGFFAAGAALMLLLSPASASAAATVGEKAPEFSLPSADGSTQSLSSFAGKTVVLEWFNAECPFVRKHYDSQNMQKLQKDAAAKDVVWLTISSSAEGKQGYLTADTAKAQIAKEGAAPAHLLLDHDGAVGKAYDAKTTPHMFVIDKNGVLVYAGAIDDKPSADKADVEGASNYVTLALAALAEGKPVETASTKAYGCGVKYKE